MGSVEPPLEASQYRQQLYDIRSADLPVPEKLSRMLSVGCEYLGVENGHIKRIDEEVGRHEVIAAANTDTGTEYPEPGQYHDHATSYCRRTIQRDSPLALSEASEQGWEDDPAYREHGLECYLGATVTVGGSTYGTVCFVDWSAKSSEFDPLERAFVEIAARIASNELESRRYEHVLGDREQLIGVLNRVLRHNLRNDMTKVRGYAEALSDRLEDRDRELARQVVETADDLVSLGRTARSIETVANDAGNLQHRDVVPVVTDVAADLRESHPEADVSVDAPASLPVYASEHLQTALGELAENAVVHGGETVELVADPAPPVDDGAIPEDPVRIAVSDDGPGLPDHERRLLEGEPETQLDHGSGLGLWLVYWAVRGSAGTIETRTDGGTTVELYLPSEANTGLEPAADRP